MQMCLENKTVKQVKLLNNQNTKEVVLLCSIITVKSPWIVMHLSKSLFVAFATKNFVISYFITSQLTEKLIFLRKSNCQTWQ